MSNVVPIDSAPELAANSAPRFGAGRDSTRAARGFLIQLVACEAQLAEYNAVWLREAGRQIEPALAQVCERLACETEALREQLIELEQRLVARWNWVERAHQIDVDALLRQPMTKVVAELVELHEAHVHGPTPWAELAALRPIEQMLAAMVPLSIDLAGFTHARESDCDELQEAARLFGARELRARELTGLLDTLIAADPQRATLVREAEEQAIAAFTKVLSECARQGRELDGPRFIR